MIAQLYLGLGTAILAAFAFTVWNGWEFRPVNRGMPPPGVALAVLRATSSGTSRSSGSRWFSSSSRSGSGIFGGK
jgi:hypothetical protein